MTDEMKHGPHKVGRKVIWVAPPEAEADPVQLEIMEWSAGCSAGSEPDKYGVYWAKTVDGKNCFVRYADFLPNGDGHVFATWAPLSGVAAAASSKDDTSTAPAVEVKS